MSQLDLRADSDPRPTSASLGSSRSDDRRDDDALGQHGRQILERVHREIDLAREHRVVDLLGEERAAADLRERDVLDNVAGGPDLHAPVTRDPRPAASRSPTPSATARACCRGCQSSERRRAETRHPATPLGRREVIRQTLRRGLAARDHVAHRHALAERSRQRQAWIPPFGFLHDLLEPAVGEIVLRNRLAPEMKGAERRLALGAEEQAKIVEHAGGDGVDVGVGEIGVADAAHERGEQ